MIRVEVHLPPGFGDSEELRHATQVGLNTLATHTFASWVEEAGRELKTSYRSYVRGIAPPQMLPEGDSYISVTGFLPLAIEFGHDAYDLRPGLLLSPKMTSQHARKRQQWQDKRVRYAALMRMREEQPNLLPTKRWVIVPFGKTISKPREGSGIVGLTHPIPPEPIRRDLEVLKRHPTKVSRTTGIAYLAGEAHERARRLFNEANMTGHEPTTRTAGMHEGRHARSGVMPKGLGGGISFRTLRDDAESSSWKHPGFQARLLHQRAVDRTLREHLEPVVSSIISAVLGAP